MIIRGDRDSLEGKASWIIAENIQDLLVGQRHVVLAVSGGSSVAGIFRYLVRENVDWERVHIFMVDELLLPFDDPQSKFRLVRVGLQEIIPLVSMYPFSCIPGAEEEGLAAYRRELEKLGGRFDILLVGSGEDGHIASLFPGFVDGSEADFLLVRDSPEPPALRMTASVRLLLRSRIGIALFFGRGKRAALQDLFDESLSLSDCPARIISRLPQHYILTDQEACG